jgi:hypothetical protein
MMELRNFQPATAGEHYFHHRMQIIKKCKEGRMVQTRQAMNLLSLRFKWRSTLNSRFLRLRFRWAVCAMDALSGKKERCTLPHHVVPFANKPRAMGHGAAAQNKYTNSLRIVQSAPRQHFIYILFYSNAQVAAWSLVCMRARQKKHTPLCDGNKQVDSTRFPPLLMHFMLSCMKLHRVRAGFVFYILCFALMGVAFTPSCMRTQERDDARFFN